MFLFHYRQRCPFYIYLIECTRGLNGYGFFSYSKKRKQDRYLNFDPRPDHAASSTADSDSFLRDLQASLSKTTMWERLLSFSYDDYELHANKRLVLQMQVQSLVSHLHVQLHFSLCTVVFSSVN
jgi:hypothetical protein